MSDISTPDKLVQHFEKMQDMARRFLEPIPYVDRQGKQWAEPHAHQSPDYAFYMRREMANAFANDMIYMLDGPEQREALTTRLAPDRTADNCHASGPWGKDEAAAITAWNTRHDSTREMVEALRNLRPLLQTVEDAINEPPRLWDIEPMEVRDYRHTLYRQWTPLCRAVLGLMKERT